MNSWLFLAFAIVFNTMANILIKKSTFQEEGIDTFLTLNFLLGVFLFGLNLVFYTIALKTLHVSIGYPVLVGVSIAGVTAISIVSLGEKITVPHSIGLLLIVLGVFILFRKPY